MDKEGIEKLSASLAITLLGLETLGTSLFIADQFFNWDIFPPAIEKIVGFILVTVFLTIISSVLVNVMINLGILAKNSSRLLQMNSRHD